MIKSPSVGKRLLTSLSPFEFSKRLRWTYCPFEVLKRVLGKANPEP